MVLAPSIYTADKTNDLTPQPIQHNSVIDRKYSIILTHIDGRIFRLL
jgi:hypothetical protein